MANVPNFFANKNPRIVQKKMETKRGKKERRNPFSKYCVMTSYLPESRVATTTVYVVILLFLFCRSVSLPLSVDLHASSMEIGYLFNNLMNNLINKFQKTVTPTTVCSMRCHTYTNIEYICRGLLFY